MPNQNRPDCKRYTQTITDYVLGEAVGVTKEELFNHLRACKQCWEEFFNWEDFYAVLRTEAHDAKPEIKARCQALVEEFKRQKPPAPPAG